MADLWYAARTNNLDLIRYHIEEKRVKVDATRWSGVTPLHRAAGVGNVEAAQLLIRLGANVKAKTYSSWETPLHMACAGGHEAAAVLLLESGAIWECIDKYARTPLQQAVKNGYGMAGQRVGQVSRALVEQRRAERTEQLLLLNQQALAAKQTSSDSRPGKLSSDSRLGKTSSDSRPGTGESDKSPIEPESETATVIWKADVLATHRVVFIDRIKFKIGDEIEACFAPSCDIFDAKIIDLRTKSLSDNKVSGHLIIETKEPEPRPNPDGFVPPYEKSKQKTVTDAQLTSKMWLLRQVGKSTVSLTRMRYSERVIVSAHERRANQDASVLEGVSEHKEG